jgi:hypothetical protein
MMKSLLVILGISGAISMMAGNTGLTKKQIAAKAARAELGAVVAPIRLADNLHDIYRLGVRVANQPKSSRAGIVKTNFPTWVEENQYNLGNPCIK